MCSCMGAEEQTVPDKELKVTQSCDKGLWLTKLLIDWSPSLPFSGLFCFSQLLTFLSILRGRLLFLRECVGKLHYGHVCLRLVIQEQSWGKEKESKRVWEVNKRKEMMLYWQMDLINNLGFIVSTGKIGPGQWLPDGGLPSPLSSSFHGIMKCKVSDRKLLQFSAQYQNMSLPFDCVYSGCESRPTMPVLTQQTDRVCAACQDAGWLELALLLLSRWGLETQILEGCAKVRFPLSWDSRNPKYFSDWKRLFRIQRPELSLWIHSLCLIPLCAGMRVLGG